ncbi:MAG: hypothetical protein VX527_06215, partial [Planctomycetota bacterium]|nr:hypothetical protein [Planctomycetota bacterium]
CIVIILMLGEQGQTHLVLAGLLIFGIPIVDTILAICRRKVQGLPMSAPDASHLHHILKAKLGGVKQAVLAVYGIEVCLAALGVALGALVLLGDLRVLIVYLVFITVYGLIGIIGIRMGLLQKRAKSMSAKVP